MSTDRNVLAAAPLATGGGSHTSVPARFESWAPDIVQRSYEIWSTLGNRNASRTEMLLAREADEGTSIPASSTIRKWASAGAWASRADADLETAHGKTLHELQVGWLAVQRLSQETLLDALAGALDGCPHGGAARLKAVEIGLRTIERAGLLAVLPEPQRAAENEEHLTLDQRARRMRSLMAERNRAG
jgi:hypothetical protein